MIGGLEVELGGNDSGINVSDKLTMVGGLEVELGANDSGGGGGGNGSDDYK